MDAAVLDLIQGVREACDPTAFFQRVVGTPDPFQIDMLTSTAPFVVLLASRQVGKSEVIACLIAHELGTKPGSFVLVIAPSERQSKELYRKVLRFKEAMDLRAVRSTQSELELENGSRLVCLPASSDTIRGFANASLILFDEAAFFPDRGDVITTVLPMRGKHGRILMASTPNGRHNQFADFWFDSNAEKVSARSVDIPRLAEKVAFDREYMPKLRFRIEHLCDFDVSNGTPFFSVEAIENAITEEACALWI
jgi:hypothetical protein